VASATKTLTIPEAMAFALDLQRQQRYGEAGAVLRGIVSVEPNHPGALMCLGVLAHVSGEREAGEQLVRGALAIDPDYASAHVNLGNMLCAAQRHDEAEASFRRALELEPSNADAWCNLGSIHNRRLEFARALECFEKATAIQPGLAEAHHNMGNAYRGLHRFDDALAAYERAGQLGGGVVATQWRAGHALTAMGRYDEAVGFFESAHRLDPRDERPLAGLARAHTLAGRTAAAAQAYRQWLGLVPGDPVAEHMLAALEGASTPQRASDEYVRQTFDGFAESFDAVLAELEYRAPELVIAAVRELYGEPAAGLDVLDAGCGTGLVGVGLKPLARRLIGVDLSEAMLAKAQARSVYDQLLQAELTQFIGSQAASWDLIVSADTLCYFGDLGPVAAAAQRALRGGGWLAFTVEHAPGHPGYRLERHGRYSHGRNYVARVLVEAGFGDPRIEEVVLRKERGTPVAGLVVCARRPHGAAAPIEAQATAGR
jgi:predicted TPR repeat methyltransferase